ncbi:hypothetical protein LEMLEM_LOCUS5698 [Lemmus lemmus]
MCVQCLQRPEEGIISPTPCGCRNRTQSYGRTNGKWSSLSRNEKAAEWHSPGSLPVASESQDEFQQPHTLGTHHCLCHRLTKASSWSRRQALGWHLASDREHTMEIF